MSRTCVTRLDSKGRIVIPGGFRGFLRLKPDSRVLVSLDRRGGKLVITPVLEKRLVALRIGLSDAPGSLARAAKALAETGVDLVSTESRSVSRGNTAEWLVFCSVDSVKSLDAVKKRVLASGAKTFSARSL